MNRLVESAKPRICFVVSAPETAIAFLNPHISVLAQHFDVDVIANFSGPNTQVTSLARHIRLPIQRTISPFSDMRALFRLHRLIRKGGYVSVHSVTPKAGLLAMAASRLARVPLRVHWFTGQVWATSNGLKRQLLKNLDRLTADNATQLLIDSESQRKFLIEQKVVPELKSKVLGHGSICGVNTEIFKSNQDSRSKIRHDLGISENDIVLLFLSRINRDKGVLDLVQALSLTRITCSLSVIFAGVDEQNLVPEIDEKITAQGIDFTYVGPTDEPESLMAAADIFCMPSHREGFGLSVIEASATEIPCIASDIYGLSDAVADKETGLLFPVGNAQALAQAIEILIGNRPLREKLGHAGRRRVTSEFSQEILTSALLDFYQDHLKTS